MKTLSLDILRLALSSVLLSSVSNAQWFFDRDGAVQSMVGQLIQTRLGPGYDFEYGVLDSQIYYSKDEMIQDPFGTLKDYVLFSASRHSEDMPPDTFVVGMIKNGTIVWDNFPGSTMDLGEGREGRLLFAQDINNDGEVELVYADYVLPTISAIDPEVVFIRVFGWNGTRGRFLSDENMVGMGEYELIDADGDGVKEIRASIEGAEGFDEFRTSTYPYVTYGWNGIRYGLRPSVKQIPKN